MIHHLKGLVKELNPAFAIIECAGIGYMVNITINTFSEIADSKEVLLYSHVIYKEDSQTIFGFTTKSEREMFLLLLSVSGVGGNTARVILSNLSSGEAASAIASSNVASLKSIKGIGAKTAERIIVDLKDKVLNGTTVDSITSANPIMTEASAALSVLGYPAKQTDRVLSAILKTNPSAAIEELIKEALNRL